MSRHDSSGLDDHSELDARLDAAFRALPDTDDLRDLRDELRASLADRVSELEASGFGPVGTIDRALAELGDIEALAAEVTGQPVTRGTVGAGGLEGGVREAAEIINNAVRAVEKRVLPEIARRDKALAREIEEEMFTFEHLFALDAQAMGVLLREVESETLVDALKGIAEDQREAFFRAMSSRAADGVKDEIAERGRLRSSDVIAAQKAGATGGVFNWLALSDHLESMLRGLVSTADVAWFVLVIAVALALATQRLAAEKERG